MHYEPVSVPIRRLWRARRRCRSGYGHSAFRSIVEPANCRRRIIGLRRLLKHTSGDATFTTWRPRTGNGCMAFDSHAFALCKLSLTNQPYLNAATLEPAGRAPARQKILPDFAPSRRFSSLSFVNMVREEKLRQVKRPGAAAQTIPSLLIGNLAGVRARNN